MRKITGLMLVVLFVCAFVIGTITSDAQAGKKQDCYIKCVNGLGYFCCIVDGEEQCEYRPNIDCIRW